MLLVVVAAAFIVLSTAFLSIIESSILSIDDLKLAKILQNKPVHAKKIKYVIRNKNEHLSSIVLLSTLISIAGSSIVGALAAKTLSGTGLVVFTGLLTYCILVFAKLLPKLVAVQISGRVLEVLAPVIKIICLLLTPLVWGTLIWVRMLRLKRPDKITRDDLKTIIKYYSKSGVIGREESFIAEHALNIHNRNLSDLLSDQGSMIWLSAEETIEEVYEKVKQSNFKRYIVVSQGRAVGIVLYRHLARAVINGEQHKTIGDLARKALFINPETTLLEALELFRSAKASVAILPGKTLEDSRFITAKQIYRAVLQKPT
ncbi:MAG: CNNM domain-containing protein [Candidatus Endonucleobacter bathymodioli]|uniref:CNNM domain-containing protein n=1 Tax=Candidatus Endonucleibacter bathymodioli TaxID=539814 RepID=A0AA90NRC3_9GAMM|nr:CNNM domain-containing protein [Candidatus Endonucleobacter bathymodioli]